MRLETGIVAERGDVNAGFSAGLKYGRFPIGDDRAAIDRQMDRVRVNEVGVGNRRSRVDSVMGVHGRLPRP
jgi:hypothetical protein